MTDAEAKRCLERIKRIGEEVWQLRCLSSSVQKGSKRNELTGSIIAIILAVGGYFLADYWSTSGSGDGIISGLLTELLSELLGFICPILAIAFVIWFIVALKNYIYEKNEVNVHGGTAQISKKMDDLVREKEQLIRMLDKSFPGTYVSWVEEMLGYMNNGLSYRSAFSKAKDNARRRSIQRAEEREEERIRAESDYRKAVLAEQQRMNENLENLQRQQEYANRLAREAESRRIYEELKRDCNKKWGE